MSLDVDAPALPWLRALTTTAIRTLDGNVVTDAAGTFIRAGGGYPDPWTRDASLNAWGAASPLRPSAARDTLLRVCEVLPDGRHVIAQDTQWWDQIVWVIAAWDHVLWTGDRAFLDTAFAIGRDSLASLHDARFRPAFGLYAGPALMQDGISGLPTPPATTVEGSSFVLDYPGAAEVMTLSTNVVYVGALRALDAMARELGTDTEDFADRADALAAAIRTQLGDGDALGYLRHADGALDHSREAAGLGLAVALGVVDAQDGAAVLASVGRGAAGAVNVAPHFADRYDDTRPGRHNAICWPMVMGLVGLGHAAIGDVDGVVAVLDDLRRLVDSSDGRFDEVYDAVTGEPSGGWQCGRLWDSEPDQTWSATSFLRLVLTGLVGVRPGVDGLRFEPLLPGTSVDVRGLPWRGALLDVTIRTGSAAGPVLSLDGAAVDAVPIDLVGAHRVDVVVAS